MDEPRDDQPDQSITDETTKLSSAEPAREERPTISYPPAQYYGYGPAYYPVHGQQPPAGYYPQGRYGPQGGYGPQASYGQSHYQPGHYQPSDYQPAGYYAMESTGSQPPPGYPWTAPLPPIGVNPVSTGIGRSPRKSRRRILVTSGLAAALAAACIAGLVTTGTNLDLTGRGSAASTLIPDTGNSANGGTSGGSGGSSGGLGGGFGSGGSGGSSGSGGTGGATSNGTATAAQEVGVVDIVTQLKYENAEAAGTGMVLTSDGEILTNNHVVDGATSIAVTVVSTGKTYTATVVGTDPTQDIAVLKLSSASGLQTAKISTTAKVAVGDAVTAVGNAGGTGGTPSTASGTVTALNQSITATDEDGSNSENLTGLIESNAPIAAGDSGGPLYNSSGEIVGIDTAGSSASSSPRGFSASTLTQAYSIPITTAMSIASEIEAGHASSTIHLGYPPFLGVQVSAASDTSGRFGGQPSTGTGTGAVVSGVVAGTPAASAGLAAGDTITAVGSTSVTSQSDLAAALAQYKAGQSVKISWTDVSGQQHSATVKLISGPAD